MVTPAFHIISNLAFIQKTADEKQQENEQFRTYVQSLDQLVVDETAHRLNDEITPLVDCQQCGNCCRSLMINVEQHELQAIADQLQTSAEQLKEKHVETSQQGMMIMNAIPCAFLDGNSCSIYQNRFSECHRFPHLDRPNFGDRLFGTLMHYGRCPIVYNVVEELKRQLGFITTEVHETVE